MDQPNVHFPLADDLDLLTDIRQIINAHEFTHLDVEQLTNDEVHLIQHYAAYILPRAVSKDRFTIFHTLADKLEALYETLNEFDFIIAPGDSPSKFINSLRLCKFQLPPVIQFPLSGLGEPEGISERLQQLLDDYIAYVLAPYNIKETSKVALFDYFSTGATYKYILTSIRKILGPKFKLTKVKVPVPPIGRGDENTNMQYSLMVEGDILGSRCVRKMPLTKYTGPESAKLEMSNVTLCNTICLLVAITYYGKLRNINPMPLIKIQDGIYTATYYIPDEINTGPIIIENEIYRVAKTRTQRPLSSIISIQNRQSIDETLLDQYIGQYVTVEFLDGSTKQAYIGEDGIYSDLALVRVNPELIQGTPMQGKIYRLRLSERPTRTWLIHLSGQYYEYSLLNKVDIIGIF